MATETKIAFIGGGELLVECEAQTLADRLAPGSTVALTKAHSDEVVVHVRSDAVAYVEEAKESKGPLAFAHR